MIFESGSPQIGDVEVDRIYTNQRGHLIGRKDQGTDHEVLYIKFKSGNYGVVRVTGVLDPSPEAAAATRQRLLDICARS